MTQKSAFNKKFISTIQQSRTQFFSPFHKTILNEQMQQLQLLNQEQIISKLKYKKQQILKQNQQLNDNCHKYFMEFTSIIILNEKRIKQNIDNQMLQYLQNIDKKMEQIQQNETCYNNQYQIYQILKLLNQNFIQIKQNIPQITQLIQKCYILSLKPLNQLSSIKQLNIISQYDFQSTNKKHLSNLSIEISEKDFQYVLSKFQQQMETNMLLNQRLKIKVKTLQDILAKKGFNLKDINRIHNQSEKNNQQEHWDLQLDRVKGQNNILTQEINNISNKLMQLTSQNQQLKAQFKKMLQSNISHISNNFNNQAINDSTVNLQQNSRLLDKFQSQNYIVQSLPIVFSNQKQSVQVSGVYLPSSHVHNIQNQILIQNQKRIDQLTIKLTKKMTQLQGVKIDNQQKDQKIKQLKQKLQQKQCQIQKSHNHLQTLQHDYQVSSKKRFQLQQKLGQTKQKLQQSQQKQNSLNIESNLQIQNLHSMLKIKEQTLLQFKQINDQKYKEQTNGVIDRMKIQRNQLEKEIQLINKINKDKQFQYQQKLQTITNQFRRIQKINLSKDQQINHLNQQLYQFNQKIRQLEQTKSDQNQLTWKQKYEQFKKQLTKIKKQSKQMKKDNQLLKLQNLKMNQLINTKIIQSNMKLQLIIKDYEKNKSSSQIMIKVYQNRIQLMKQKLQQLLSQNIPNTQSKKLTPQVIQKFILSMNSFCLKNADIKRFKQQIKQLKSKNLTKPIKKQLIKNVQSYGINIDQNNQQINQLQRNMFLDRFKIEKKIMQEKIVLLQQQNQFGRQKLSSKLNIIKQLQDQMTKIRKQIKKFSYQQKKHDNQQNYQSQIESFKQKIQKLQVQLKNNKNIQKKTQQQLTLSKNELNKKKDHIQNMKKQLTQKQSQLQNYKANLKYKNDQIQKLKYQIKDLSTKQTYISQMKQKVEQYCILQNTNQDLKKQIQKTNSLHKFQLSKVQSQLKQLKVDKKIQIQTKIFNKTSQLNDQLNQLKLKYKKLKNDLDRKQQLIQHTKSKYQNKLQSLQQQLNQKSNQILTKRKDVETNDKKLQILSINQKKYKDKCKLLTVLVTKIYQKIVKLTESQQNNKKYTNKSKQNQILLTNTSPITRVYNNSNLMNITGGTNGLSYQKLNQFNINLDDLQKYSQGLEMFNINTSQLKNLQNGFNDHNQNSTFSHLMCSPTNQSKYQSNSQYKTYKTLSYQEKRESLNKLSDSLNGKEQININQILTYFDRLLIRQQA